MVASSERRLQAQLSWLRARSVCGPHGRGKHLRLQNYLSRGHQVGYWTAGEGDDSGLELSAYLTVAREEVCDRFIRYNYNTAQIQQQNEFPQAQ
ncbi:MAG: hypothetical protein WKH64_15940 [Chloroflexia bacterium]